jgi:hypothetical protein
VCNLIFYLFISHSSSAVLGAILLVLLVVQLNAALLDVPHFLTTILSAPIYVLVVDLRHVKTKKK